jgi:hypothetical protein
MPRRVARGRNLHRERLVYSEDGDRIGDSAARATSDGAPPRSRRDAALGRAPLEPMGVIDRFVGILRAPRRTYMELAARPRWFDMLALVTAVLGVTSAALLSTEVGRLAWTDTIRDSEIVGRYVSDADLLTLERWLPLVGVGQALLVALRAVLLAAVLGAVFAGVLGGHASFVQVLSVVTHALVVYAVRGLVLTPIAYARESLGSPATLASVLPVNDGTFAARVAGSFDVFFVWWIVVLAIGLATLYGRRARSIALGLFAVYGALAVTSAAVAAILEPS